MPATPHVEKHFTASGSVRDVVISMADGLTVPFALAADLSANGIWEKISKLCIFPVAARL